MAAPAGEIVVLHVEDEPEFAELTASALERMDDGLRVETAETVSGGLERFDEGGIDCIVSDYDLPPRDGIDFLEAVRERDPDVPFILFTGKGSEAVASEAVSAGVTDYLQKESGTDQYAILANRIRNAVEGFRAERTAERTERRLAELARNSNDILWTFSADWSELLFLNEAYADIWGQPVERLYEEPTAFLDGVHPEDRDLARDAMERLSAGESVDIEFRVNESESYGRWVWVEGEPIREAGEVVRVAGFARDITDRKRRETALEELHAVAADLPSCDTDEAVCRRLVAAAENVLEFDMCVTNLESNGWLTVVASSEELPDEGVTRMAVDEGIAGKTYRTGESFRVEDVRESAAADPQGPYRSALSIPMGEHGIFQTVSETVGDFDEDDRELAELLAAHAVRELDRIAYERSLERYETIVEASGDGIYAVDADGRYTLVNEAFAALTGYERSELLGTYASDVLDAASYDRSTEHVRRFLSAESDATKTTHEVTVVTADGEEISCEDSLALLPTEDGDYRGVAGIVRDISERKARERELERRNERLDAFTSVVSHDLRNPLNVALGRVELADETCDSPHLDDAAHALDRMETLIDDLLTLAREGQRVGETEPVALADAVERCQRTVAAAGTTVTVETDRTVLADPSRLNELLGNLLRNAVEHGGTDVTVTVGELPDGFYVEDDGPGITPDRREQIFERGYTTSDGGTGFGLAIVAEIAEAHGWSVDATEGAAGGARFEITGVETPG